MQVRRPFRIALYVVAALAALALLSVVVLLLALQTRGGGEWLARAAAGQVAQYVNGEVSIGRIQGNLFSSATLHDVVLSRNGAPVISIERVSAGYDLAGLLGGGDIALDDINLVRPEISLVRGPDGRLAIAELFGGGEPAPDPEAPARRLSISPIVIREGHITVGPTPAEAGGFEVPDELRHVNARLSLRQGPEGARVQVDRLSFVGADPAFTLQNLSGEIVYENGDLVFDGVTVRTVENQLTLNGAIRNLTARGAS